MAEELVIENRKRRRRGRRIGCCILITLAVLVVLLLLLLICVIVSKGFGKWEDKGCTSPECVDAASRIRRNMDPSANPCEDFYQYACGNFKNEHVIPPGDASLSSFGLLRKKQNIRMKNLLEESNPADPGYAKEAKKFYQSCMNEDKIDELGVKPLKDYVKKLGGWNILDKNFDLSAFELEDYWAKLSKDSSYPGWYNRIFGIGVEVDPDFNEKHVIQMRQVGLGMGGGTRENYLKGRADDLVKAYEKLMVDVANLLGVGEKDYDANYAKAELAKIVDFEIELAKINLKPEDLRESAGHSEVITVGDLNSKITEVDWKRAITKLFEPVNIAIKDTDRVHVHAKPFFLALGALIKKTHSKTLAGYLMWRVIKSNLHHMDKKTREINAEFTNLRYGTSQEEPRHETCVARTNYRFPLPIARMFVDKYFKGSLDGMKDLTERVKEAFKERLNDADWLDKPSREKAVEKVDAMTSRIGYPDFIKDDAKLKAEIDKLGVGEIDKDKYFENVIEIVGKMGEKRLKKLPQPADKEWREMAVVVNAFYTPWKNLMSYPVGILYPPFYSIDGLQALNFGGIGEVIGHEITHGFDDSGRLYDKSGNKKNWMTQASIDKFNEKAKCVIDSYSNIKVEQVNENVNGKLTQGENIADLGGLAQSFDAYQKWVSENGSEKPLPGLDLTSNQLFFLAYAQTGCSLATDEALKIKIRANSHTPAKERVLGALFNTKEFAEAYECKAGSRMNPDKKCVIW